MSTSDAKAIVAQMKQGDSTTLRELTDSNFRMFGHWLLDYLKAETMDLDVGVATEDVLLICRGVDACKREFGTMRMFVDEMKRRGWIGSPLASVD